MLDNKPAPMQHILKAFNHDSASIKAATCSECHPFRGLLTVVVKRLTQKNLLTKGYTAVSHISPGLFRVLAQKEDSRPRLWKAIKEWDWSLLFSCLQMQARG